MTVITAATFFLKRLGGFISIPFRKYFNVFLLLYIFTYFNQKKNNDVICNKNVFKNYISFTKLTIWLLCLNKQTYLPPDILTDELAWRCIYLLLLRLQQHPNLTSSSIKLGNKLIFYSSSKLYEYVLVHLLRGLLIDQTCQICVRIK